MTNEQSAFSSLFFSLQPSFHTICYAITIPQSINFFNIFLCFRIFYSFSMILFYLFLTYLSFIQTNPKPTLDSLFLCICTFFSNKSSPLIFHYFSLFFIIFNLPSPMMPAMLLISWIRSILLSKQLLHPHHPAHLLSELWFPLASLDPDFSSHRTLPRIILHFVFDPHQ